MKYIMILGALLVVTTIVKHGIDPTATYSAYAERMADDAARDQIMFAGLSDGEERINRLDRRIADLEERAVTRY